MPPPTQTDTDTTATDEAARRAVAAIPPDELWSELGADMEKAMGRTGFSRNELFRLIRVGVLRPIRVGKYRRIVFPRRALQAVLEAMDRSMTRG